jgi:hypothetical protein
MANLQILQAALLPLAILPAAVDPATTMATANALLIAAKAILAAGFPTPVASVRVMCDP